MIKSDVVGHLHKRIGGLNREEISQCVKFIFDSIENALAKSESVKIANFGVFSTRYKRERMGRNPRTLEAAVIPARRVVSFRVSDSVLKKLNDAHDERQNGLCEPDEPSL